MGAFDGLCFYQSTRNTRRSEETHQPAMETYYVSWWGSNGGFTGKHFDSREEADQCWNKKSVEGKEPAKWYKEAQ